MQNKSKNVPLSVLIDILHAIELRTAYSIHHQIITPRSSKRPHLVGIIGASLSEPHTNVTLNFNVMKIELIHLVGDGEGLLPRVQRRLPGVGVEATEVEAHMPTYCSFATNQRQLAYRQYNFDHDVDSEAVTRQDGKGHA